MVLLRGALSAFSGSAKVEISHNWRAWVEMRDLASGILGEAGEGQRVWRYDEGAIEYHYTQDREVLRRCRDLMLRCH